MHYASIKATGRYLPQNIVTNKDLEARVETTDEWIVSRTGISQRHIASDDETTVFMATQAAKTALEKAQWAPTDLDLIIVATATPDHIFPATACEVQARLGATCPAFDIQAACTGFVYALNIASQYIRTGAASRILIIGAETLSRLIDWTDRSTCVLFGDGAGACLLEASDQPGVMDTQLYAQGDLGHLLSVDNWHTQTDAKRLTVVPKLHMQGNQVFKSAVTRLEDMVDCVLKKHQLKAEEIDWLVPHQANIRIIQTTAQRLKLPMSKVVCTVGHHGNTSAASIPLALDEAWEKGQVKRGQLLLLESFGGGLTWGYALLTL